jgi:hypothetical protein
VPDAQHSSDLNAPRVHAQLAANERLVMPAPLKPVSIPLLLTLIFLGSGVLLLGYAYWFVALPAAKESLHAFAGKVTDATDTKHYKGAGETANFRLSMAGQHGDPLLLDVVKQNVRPDDVRALVGRTITALHDGSLIYELRSEQQLLFTYDDTSRIVAQEAKAFYWSGAISLGLGLVLAAWTHFGQRDRAPPAAPLDKRS